jgi:hypothetical protein
VPQNARALTPQNAAFFTPKGAGAGRQISESLFSLRLRETGFDV